MALCAFNSSLLRLCSSENTRGFGCTEFSPVALLVLVVQFVDITVVMLATVIVVIIPKAS